MRVAVVQGTRPEIIKNYAVVKALSEAGAKFEVLHTNQHSRTSMSSGIYADLGYTASRTLPVRYRLGAAIDWLQDTFKQDRIDHVIVNGDTAASIAGALAALYLGIAVSHVEAGLRSGDGEMLEERNRIMVDAIADLLFAYTSVERASLLRLSSIRGQVLALGNTTVDVLHDFACRFARRPRSGRYMLVTLHRKEFTDSPARMLAVFSALARIADRLCDVVLPMHPRTRDAVCRHGIPARALGGVQVLDPVSTFESLALQKHAAAVLTDSGCLQEEAYLLNVPCITIRENTERHLTVRYGANVVAGFEPQRIFAAAERALTARHKAWPQIYGAHGAGRRIVDAILATSAESMRPRGFVRLTPDAALWP